MLQEIAAILLVLLASGLVARKFYREFKGRSGSTCPFCDHKCKESKHEDE